MDTEEAQAERDSCLVRKDRSTSKYQDENWVDWIIWNEPRCDHRAAMTRYLILHRTNNFYVVVSFASCLAFSLIGAF